MMAGINRRWRDLITSADADEHIWGYFCNRDFPAGLCQSSPAWTSLPPPIKTGPIEGKPYLEHSAAAHPPVRESARECLENNIRM
jgi:hypothetical protein